MSSRFPVMPLSAEAVRQYRDENETGVIEAKLALRKAAIAASLRELCAAGDLQDKIDWLLARYAEDLGIPLPLPGNGDDPEPEHAVDSPSG